MKGKELTAEEKLQRIIDQITEVKSDSISVNKLKDIIGIGSGRGRHAGNPYITGMVYKEYENVMEYKESYIS